jgi:hypothetical protein
MVALHNLRRRKLFLKEQSGHLQKLLCAPKDLRVCKLNSSLLIAMKNLSPSLPVSMANEPKVTYAACEKNNPPYFEFTWL